MEPTFRTANGNLRFWQIGELISRVWNDAHPSTPMYPKGSNTDDVTFPCIIWGSGGRKMSQRSPMKPRTTDSGFHTESGAVLTRVDAWHDVTLQATIKTDNPLEAMQLEDVFIDFMLEFTGTFKKLGTFEVIFLSSEQIKPEEVAGKNVSGFVVSYLIVEQRSRVITENMIDSVEIHVRAITPLEEGDDLVSHVPPTIP